MNSKEITVNVCSSAGVGKTTIARAIKYVLESGGIDSKINDIDNVEEDGVGDLYQLHDAIRNLSERGIVVNINTVQTPRVSPNDDPE